MKTLKAPRIHLGRSAVSVPALLLLGTLSGSALAATEIEPPCPEAANSSDALHAFIEQDAAPATIAETVDASETIQSSQPSATRIVANPDDPGPVEDREIKEAAQSELTTRLPGIAVNDLPGFRRHMFRTDI